MNKFLSIQKAAAFLGVSTQALRRWERSKKIEPAQRTDDLQRQAHMLEMYCSSQGWSYEIIKDLGFGAELAKDVLEIITVFSARLYGSRSRKNKHLMDNPNKAVHATKS